MKRLPIIVCMVLLAVCAWAPLRGFAYNPFKPTPHELGVQAYHQGRYEEALGHLEAAIHSNPANHLSLYYMAVTLVQLNRHAEAMPYYREVTRIAPETEAGRNAKQAIRAFGGMQPMAARPQWNVVNRRDDAIGQTGMIDVSYSPPSDGEGDYLGAAGPIRRWAAQRIPLKIYIEKAPEARRYVEAKRAIDAWVAASDGLFSYREVTVPDGADIQLVWVHHLEAGSQLWGSTARAHPVIIC